MKIHSQCFCATAEGVSKRRARGAHDLPMARVQGEKRSVRQGTEHSYIVAGSGLPAVPSFPLGLALSRATRLGNYHKRFEVRAGIGYALARPALEATTLGPEDRAPLGGGDKCYAAPSLPSVRLACAARAHPHGELRTLGVRVPPSFKHTNVGSAPFVAITDGALRLRVARRLYARLSRRSRPCPPYNFERSDPTRNRGAARQWLQILVEQHASEMTSGGRPKAKNAQKVRGLARGTQASRLRRMQRMEYPLAYPLGLLVMQESEMTTKRPQKKNLRQLKMN